MTHTELGEGRLDVAASTTRWEAGGCAEGVVLNDSLKTEEKMVMTPSASSREANLRPR